MKTACEELKELISAHGIPQAGEKLPSWLSAFSEKHEVKFAKPEYLIDWLRRPEKWMLGPRFELLD